MRLRRIFALTRDCPELRSMKRNHNDKHAASQSNGSNIVELDMDALWKDLRSLINQVVEQMNSIEEFRERTGALDVHDGPSDTIIVNKELPPAVYLTLSRCADAIDVHRRIAMTAPTSKDQETREILRLEINKNRSLLFRNKSDESLTIEQTVFYILRPFLRPALLFNEEAT
jgi:hypothetical protein